MVSSDADIVQTLQRVDVCGLWISGYTVYLYQRVDTTKRDR